MMYFIGNVLDSHEDARRHPEASKEYFHITPTEASRMDAVGLPVHLEHADNVKVGSVLRSWNDNDGKKWILAHVDTSSIEGKFVRNDLSAEVPVYSSLSLQHVYRKFTDGSSQKSAVEVSICKEPRRPGCKIVHASMSSGSTVYKGSSDNTRMSTNEKPTETVPSTEPPSSEVDVKASADNSTTCETAPTPSTTQLMAEVVEASRQNTLLQEQLEQKSAALAKIEKDKLQAEANVRQEKSQLAQELGDAVLEHVAKLDPSLANKATTEAIGTLREQYPREVARLLEVACCASKHASKLEAELSAQKEEAERKLMEQRYRAAVAEKPGCHGVQAEETVSASNKRQRTDVGSSNPYVVQKSAPTSRYGTLDTINQIHEAYQGLRGRGSTTDAMKTIAGIIPQQRNSGFR